MHQQTAYMGAALQRRRKSTQQERRYLGLTRNAFVDDEIRYLYSSMFGISTRLSYLYSPTADQIDIVLSPPYLSYFLYDAKFLIVAT